jgi:hypothetical protein
LSEHSEGGENLPLTPAKVAEVLTAAGIQLKAGWLPAGKSLMDDTNAWQLIRTSTRARLTGYTIVRTNDAGGTPPTRALKGRDSSNS